MRVWIELIDPSNTFSSLESGLISGLIADDVAHDTTF
jgi:hypothetical protein